MPSSAKREEIERVMLDPCSLLPDPIGKAGFAVPDIRSFAWHPLGDPTDDNWIVASPEVDPKAERSFRITEKSRNNIFVLGDQCKVVGNNFVDGSNNLSILIGVKYGVHPVHLQLKSDNHVFFWGEGCTSNSNTFIESEVTSNIIVGEHCMFAYDVVVRTHDEHGIVDLDTGATINDDKSVLLHPAVWVGEGAKIMKGVQIGFGSIVAAGAIVAKDVPATTLVGGVPARTLRSNVGWTREAIPRAGAHERILADRERFVLESAKSR